MLSLLLTHTVRRSDYPIIKKKKCIVRLEYIFIMAQDKYISNAKIIPGMKSYNEYQFW